MSQIFSLISDTQLVTIRAGGLLESEITDTFIKALLSFERPDETFALLGSRANLEQAWKGKHRDR